jgi:BolA family transcriptional regulator, general stress-responsive regulator
MVAAAGGGLEGARHAAPAALTLLLVGETRRSNPKGSLFDMVGTFSTRTAEFSVLGRGIEEARWHQMTVTDEIRDRLQAAPSRPERLDVVDESEQHRGHAGFREGGESHFRVTILESPVFADDDPDRAASRRACGAGARPRGPDPCARSEGQRLTQSRLV